MPLQLELGPAPSESLLVHRHQAVVVAIFQVLCARAWARSMSLIMTSKEVVGRASIVAEKQKRKKGNLDKNTKKVWAEGIDNPRQTLRLLQGYQATQALPPCMCMVRTHNAYGTQFRA